MSIPKTIHYCWFGGKPLPESVKGCIASWKKHCPDYEIRLWNEDNLDISRSRYASEALAEKQWAFVSDWARLFIVYSFGGIYLDTDVELIGSPDGLADSCDCFFGFENESLIATGLGFGAKKNHPLVGCLLGDYSDIAFVREDGSLDKTACPIRNTRAIEKYFGESVEQLKQKPERDGIRLLPPEYLCPLEYYSQKLNITENTVSIHHYDASWVSPMGRKLAKLRRLVGNKSYDFLMGHILWHFNKNGKYW